MTNKQIIIDGVDVSGCEWIREVGLDSEYICTCNSPNKTSGYCKYNPNCRYKQLKRKEQECEMWKNLTVDNGAVALKYQQQLDQLKAENDELKGIRDRNFLHALEEQKRADKYFKTLTEIKEIVKPHQRNIDKICGHCRRYDGCHACCIDDINCYQYKKPTTPACDKYCELKEFEINNIANQILQKISEVEDEKV